MGHRNDSGLAGIAFPTRPAQRTVRRASALAAAVALEVVVAVGAVASVSAGDLDTTFSGDGWAATNLSPYADHPVDVAVTPAGDILLAGTSGPCCSDLRMGIVSYLPSGNRDATFGTNGSGIVSTGWNYKDAEIDGIALQSDGKIVIGGVVHTSSGYDLAVARLNADGSVDKNFGDHSGLQLLDPSGGGDDITRGVAIDSQDRILVAAQPPDGGMTIVRLLSDGSLDTDFSGDGYSTFSKVGEQTIATVDGLTVSGGRVYAVGSLEPATPSGTPHAVVVALKANGDLDTSFSGDGLATESLLPELAYTPGIAVDSKGNVVIGGAVTGDDYEGQLMSLRFTPAGDLDSTYSTDGFATAGPSDGESALVGRNVAIDSNDNVIVVGVNYRGGDEDGMLSIVRWTKTGDADLTFSGDGYDEPATPSGAKGAAGTTVTVDANDNIIAGGYLVVTDGNPTNLEFGAARILGGNSATADKDHDGVPDASDKCPTVVGQARSGCPTIKRSLSLHYAVHASAFKGKLAAGRLPCEAHHKVAVFRKEAGADKRIGTDRTSRAGKFGVDATHGHGKYYAKAKATTVPTTGTCAAARSSIVKLK
jgi:uncharacterized delta-60 repeat protein